MGKKKNKEYKTLLSLIANFNPEEANILLKENTGESAKNVKELEFKLARMYAVSTSKPELEKKFADMHPHKEFIEKYIVPKKVDLPKEEPKKDEVVIVSDNKIPADGVCNCNCQKHSNIDGANVVTKDGYDKNLAFVVVGAVSVVAIFSIFAYIQKNK